MKSISLFTVVALIIALFCGCAASEPTPPDALTVLADGEEITALTVVNGAQCPELTAVISPEDYSGEIHWESSDEGVLRIANEDSQTCTLSTLKTGTAKITVSCGGLETTVKVTVEKNQKQLSERETAYYIGDTRYSAEVLNLYYVDAYVYFVETYGEYTSYFGLDTETGLTGLDEQSCDYSSDGTWKGYFLETACSNLLYSVALCDWAEENGCTLTEEETESIREQMVELEELAAEEGYEDADAYLKALYGSGMTGEIYEEHITQIALAEAAYTAYSDSLSYTDEELETHYIEMGYEEGENDYPTTAMRHILIMAEADEDGSYSDEAISAAHEKAQEVYDEWQAGEATEESFAELAAQYSDDTGSVSEGGLYENIAQGDMVDGIDTWLFAKNRSEGDTAVIDNNGSYVGTHVVFFCGTGEIYSRYLARTDLMDTAISNWTDELMGAYTTTEGTDYSNVGNF